MDKILEFKHATSKEKSAARRISKKLKLGEIYFAYNLPMQVSLCHKDEDDPKSGIDIYESYVWNYMPRKSRIDEQRLADLFSAPDKVTKSDIKDFMVATAAIIRNLGKQMLKVGSGKTDYVCYPNCED